MLRCFPLSLSANHFFLNIRVSVCVGCYSCLLKAFSLEDTIRPLLSIFLAISNVEIYEKGEGTPRDAY